MISHERLLSFLLYAPEEGAFYWLVNRGKGRKGRKAGYLHTKGYWYIQIDGKMYQAHRLAWFYVMREWPDEEIDHKDRDPSNYRWLNLRLATRTQNNINKGLYRTNTSGAKGVSLHKGRNQFEAYMWVNNVKKHLGWFNNVCEAEVVAREARIEHYGEFAIQE